MNLTKHQQIISFIEKLEIGNKVSVRFIAKELDVSEGTAYRAIKEAEAKGLVRSIPKVGTIRIEDVRERQIEDLTLREVAHFVDGLVICGNEYLERTPNRFIIAAMEIETMKRYLEEGALCILGNRHEAQLIALENQVSLLVTSGLEIDQDVIEKAKAMNLVVIQSPYDTFTVTTMINRALYDRLIEKDLILVEDIMVKDVDYLTNVATVADWHELAHSSGHSRFPVVDEGFTVVGIVTAVEVAGKELNTPVIEVMNPRPFTVSREDSLTHVSRLMVWEGWDNSIVVDQGKLLGIISLQDVIESFQQIQKQPQFGETVDNLILSGFRYVSGSEHLTIEGEVTQFMVNDFGSASCGVLVTLMNMVGYIALRKQHRLDAITENFTLYQLQPLPVGTKIQVTAKLLLLAKKHCAIEMEVTDLMKESLLAKGMMTARIGNKNHTGE